MTAPRVAIVVLVLLAVLYVTGVALGVRGGSSTPSIGWVESLSASLTPRLDFEKVKGDCVDRTAKAFVIRAGTPCEVSIPAGRGTRKLALRLSAGARVEGRYKAPAEHEKIDTQDESAEQPLTLDDDKIRSVVVLKEGGTLSLECHGDEKTPCKVEAS